LFSEFEIEEEQLGTNSVSAVPGRKRNLNNNNGGNLSRSRNPRERPMKSCRERGFSTQNH